MHLVELPDLTDREAQEHIVVLNVLQPLLGLASNLAQMSFPRQRLPVELHQTRLDEPGRLEHAPERKRVDQSSRSGLESLEGGEDDGLSHRRSVEGTGHSGDLIQTAPKRNESPIRPVRAEVSLETRQAVDRSRKFTAEG